MPSASPTASDSRLRVPMSDQDSLWLTMDRPTSLMVVDGAMVLGARPTVREVRKVFSRAVERFPVLHRRPVRSGNGWAWEDDPEFDLVRHVSSVTLPAPADMRALQEFLAQQRAEPLDKDRPVWRAFLVRNLKLEDGTAGSAIVTRFHHALADGVRLTQLMLSLCDGDHHGVSAVVAHPAAMPTDAVAVAGGAVSVAAGMGFDAVAATTGLLALTGRTLRRGPGAVLEEVLGALNEARRPERWSEAISALGVDEHRATADLTSIAKIAGSSSPATVWTGKPGKRKAVAWTPPMPLDEIKHVGRHHKCTVNDVLITAVSGALARYLADRDASVDQVMWMVPVNLKPHERTLPSELGNYFALVFLPMPLDDPDRRTRMKRIHGHMKRIKAADEAVITFGMQRVVSWSPSPMATALTTFFADKAVGVLTNVPGPRGELTFAGAPVLQVVGFAPCSGKQPMTATIFSYAGAVTVGFASDAGLVPDPEVLSSYVADEVAAMVAEVGSPHEAATAAEGNA